jgi:hypothetical protein
MLKLAIATLVGATSLMSVPTAAQAQQYQHGRDAQVTCSSHKSQYSTCRMPYRGSAQLVHQLSRQSCVRGRSWGQTRDSRVWVSRGCRADFAVRSSDRRYLDNRVGSRDFIRDRNYGVTCRANGYRTTCAWDTRYGNPYLIDTMSGTCVEGRDWGYTSDGRIWVDEYCNARFGYRGTY